MPPSPSPASAPSPAPAPAQHNPHHVLLGAISVIVLAVALLVGIELARSNADWICRKVVTIEGTCTNGSWGSWAQLSQSTDQNSCTRTTLEHRYYTGTRMSQATLEYESGRTTCRADFTASIKNYEYGGESRFLTGSVTSEYAACQIEETRTLVAAGNGFGTSCVISGANVITSQKIEGDTTGGSASSQTTAGLNEAQFWQEIDNLSTVHIQATPSIIRKGETSTISWKSTFMAACSVSATNSDHWPLTQVAALTGSETSGVINQKTTYTLTCRTESGFTKTDEATVDIIPEFQEK